MKNATFFFVTWKEWQRTRFQLIRTYDIVCGTQALTHFCFIKILLKSTIINQTDLKKGRRKRILRLTSQAQEH